MSAPLRTSTTEEMLAAFGVFTVKWLAKVMQGFDGKYGDRVVQGEEAEGTMLLIEGCVAGAPFDWNKYAGR